MTEEQIAAFCEFTAASPTEARVFLNHHSHDLEQAVDAYLLRPTRYAAEIRDLQNGAQEPELPPDHDTDDLAALLRHFRDLVDNLDDSGDLEPEPEPEAPIPPVLFSPLRPVRPESPAIVVPKPKLNVGASAAGVCPDLELETVKCVLWRNGIEWGGKFFKNGTKGSKEVREAVKANRLPSVCKGIVDLEVVVRKDSDYTQ
jgi:hypothetical protein